MVRFPEATKRLFHNTFVCKKCKSKQKADIRKVLLKKISCRRCGNKTFRIIKSKRWLVIVNYDLVLLFSFGLVLLLIMLLNKKKVHVEKILFPLIYMVLYRTKIGLILMDRIAKRFPRAVNLFSFLAVIFGFTGMAAILILLIDGTYAFLFSGAPPPVAPLFPGIRTAPGLPVLSFFHWIIAIFILAAVHEFSHGLVSRLYNIRVKSSGFAIFSFLLPIIPAAFVEPDEYQLSKAKNKEQLGVLAAGSFSNLLTAGIFFLIFL